MTALSGAGNALCRDARLMALSALIGQPPARAAVVMNDILGAANRAALVSTDHVNALWDGALAVFGAVYAQAGDVEVALAQAEAWLESPAAWRSLGAVWHIEAWRTERRANP